MKYVVKHININHLRHKNLFLKYYSDIDFKHYVFRIGEATHFESKKRVREILKKFKHPDLWEVVVITDGQKEKR